MSFSQDLNWLLLRKSNSFIVKRTPEGPVFSSEPGNLLNLHSYKYSGLVNNKTVAITPAGETAGVTLAFRSADVELSPVANGNGWPGQVQTVAYMGGREEYVITCGSAEIKAERATQNLVLGSAVQVSVPAGLIRVWADS